MGDTMRFDGWCHGMRQQIDACIKQTKAVQDSKPEKGGREIALCHTKLQEAKMWIGKALEEFGSQLPEEFRDEAK